MTALRSRSAAGDPEIRARILDAARTKFFSLGYSAVTMDELADELGMSKKTLYVYFSSKDEMIAVLIEEFVADIRTMADRVFNDPALSFPVKLHRFSEAMAGRLRLLPHFLRDLQRSAPQIYRQIEEFRHKNIPIIFGRLVRQGQAAGMVRPEVDPDFAIEFWRPAVQSLLHPETLDRLNLTPDQVFDRAIDLFFGGMLTPAGRKDYEKHLHD